MNIRHATPPRDTFMQGPGLEFATAWTALGGTTSRDFETREPSRVPRSWTSCSGVARLFALSLLLGWAGTAYAYVTVGPSGTHATIQQGIDAAIAAGGDDVRVQHKCFTFCPYVENISFDTTAGINVSGGWATDFQSQIGGVNTPVVGTGADAPIIHARAHGSATVSLSRFGLVGGGNGSAQTHTRGLLAEAFDSAVLLVHDAAVDENQLEVSISSPFPQGGAGVALSASGSSHIVMSGILVQSNVLLGTDTFPVPGGGVSLIARGDAQIDFNLNHLVGNTVSNPNGGRCLGGGLEADTQDHANIELRANRYDGNALVFCTSGADGDASRLRADNTSSGTGISSYEEIWDNNRLGQDPGVYQVFIEAHNAASVHGANGLVSNGAWGGILAATDGSATMTLSNFTVTAHPAVGFTASGGGTQVVNTLMWGSGTDADARNGASFAASLAGIDPLFVDAANGNYRLSAGSPAIDAGSNVPGGGLRPFDLDGSLRPFNGIADIGAYEYHFGDTVFADGFDP
jgi:hypothetical protein